MADHTDAATQNGSTAREDLDKLFQVLADFAEQMLAKHGEFHPFGAALSTDGEIQLVAGQQDSEFPDPHEVIDRLTSAHRSQAASGAIRAAGISVDSRTVPPGQTKKIDAIIISLEHRSGEAADVVVPYRKNWLRRIQTGEPYAARREPTFFTNDAPPKAATSE